MNRIFLLEIPENLPGKIRDHEFTEYKKYLSGRIDEPALKGRILTDILLRYVLNQVHGISHEAQIIRITDLDKPYLHGYRNIHFNISHSRNFAVLVTGRGSCGVDIEDLNPRRSEAKLVHRFFHPQEVALYHGLSDPRDRTHYFFRIWTLKEAFLKAKGSGIREQLSNICFRRSEKSSDIWLSDGKGKDWIYREHDDIEKAYILSTAFSDDEDPEITFINTEQLFSKL